VSSFSEQVCQAFDDTGLSEVVDDSACPAGLTQDAFVALKDLARAVTRVDVSAPPEELLAAATVEAVREKAALALALVQRER
jgi:hypothetical protein